MALLSQSSDDVSKRVAIVVPTYSEHLSADEEISRRHLMHFLEGYDKYLIAPHSLRMEWPGFGMKRFGDEFFRNPLTYSLLLLSGEFYRAFADYEFILIYQLDALVFSDQLSHWCAKGWDYIGAPWVKCKEVDFVNEATVGNGGFSLRRVQSFLKVIDSHGFASELERYRDVFTTKPVMPRGPQAEAQTRITQRIARRLGLFQRQTPDTLGISAAAMLGYGLNEDFFWSLKAANYYPGFSISTVEDALRFSFEVAPRLCYQMNGYRLPFGCHAWNRYDRKFWEPFLLK